MIKNKNVLLLYLNLIGLLLIVSFLIYSTFQTSEKIVYVDNVKLFDGFYMTKEMKRIGEKEFNSKKSIVDTLYAKLQSALISEAQKKQLMPQFVQSKQALEQFNQGFATIEVPKIWSRINGYASEFAKQNNYKLIIGSDNKQTILFADEKIEVTQNLLTYINKKYEGFK